MRDLKSRANRQQLKADFEAYLDGFSPNVQDILENFEFRNQIPRLSKADALGTLIEKLTSPEIDLSPAGLDNHGMGSIFEELVRKFNEENNEEATDPVAMLKRTLLVNAFDEPQLVKHARVIVERRLEGKTYKEIAKELDLTEYNMENCAAITRLMEAAGLPEPYRRLTEKPDYVLQWCIKHWLKAGERKGGGKRRRAS